MRVKAGGRRAVHLTAWGPEGRCWAVAGSRLDRDAEDSGESLKRFKLAGDVKWHIGKLAMAECGWTVDSRLQHQKRELA